MKKNLFIVFAFLLFVSLLFSAFYYPNYYLPYYYPFENNKADVYKINPGVSLNNEQIYFLEAFKQKNETTVDYENQLVEVKVKYEQYLLTEPFLISWDDYLDNSFEAVFKSLLVQTKKDILRQKDRQSTTGIIPDIVIKLPPMALPKGVKKIMGTKAGRLNLSGSQKITFGVSRTKKETTQSTNVNNPANFDFTMKQDLNLNLNGTIGEKINVNVKYASGQETEILDPNNIKLSYTGDEDEIVQSIEAGNTSLTLSGSRFIGVTASSQGLFGVKTLLKVGDLNITAIASKEESQKNNKTFKGNSEADSSLININNFSKRTHYYIIRPDSMFELYTADELPSNGGPLWVNNAIKTTPDGKLILQSGATSRFPKNGTLKVYVDNNNGSDNNLAIPGTLIDDNSITGLMFDLQSEGDDYDYNYEDGILTFYRTIDKQYTIGVTYTQNDGDIIGSESASALQIKAIKISNQDINSPTWLYQQRNRYSLGSSNIKNDGFDLRILYQKPSGQFDETVVNDSLSEVISDLYYYKYFNLDSDNNGIVNGDDNTIDLSGGYILFPFIEPFRIVKDTLLYVNEDDNSSSYKHLISVKGKVGRESYELGFMIIKGSVKIKANGREITEGVDYIVDYDMGTVTILNKEYKSPDTELVIDYESKQQFAIESKSLFGIRADWLLTDQAKLGGTFIYQSEKVSDKRPKIGNESRSLMLADIDGEVKFEPEFITKAVDFLPFIKTDVESKITISGEVAMNIPKIYNSSSNAHKNEAWIDDMEGVLDSYPLGIGYLTWVPGSKPFQMDLLRGKINWNSPSYYYARDVYDPETLSEKERRELVSVLSMRLIPPNIHIPGLSTPFYAGLQKYVGNEIDFSDKEYIEVLVKVENSDSLLNPVKMYFDLGDVSEDYYTDFGGLGILNSEDGVVDNYRNGKLDLGEDVGLDGLANGSNDPGEDPFDNFEDDESPHNSHENPYINGSEGNARLDTEDLNENSKLDITEKLFRYSVTLNDKLTPFYQSEYKGWHLYRIPLKKNQQSEILSNVTSRPDLKKVSYVRLWFESDSYAKINVVYMDIIGNKWTKMVIRERELLNEAIVPIADQNFLNEYFSIETSDNQKDNHYVAPPNTTEKGKDEEISFEQSLKTLYTNIQPGHIALNRQGYKTPYNLLNYNNLKYWIYTEGQNDLDSLDILIRLGADSLNYYEISKRFQVNKLSSTMTESLWQEVTLPFNYITYLKSIIAIDTKDTLYSRDGFTFRKIRQPTLSNIKEMAVGIQVPQSQSPFTGTVYFNEIRVSDPNQDIGFAARSTFDTKFADFSTLTINYEWKTSDFYSSYNRSSATGVGAEDKTSLNIDNKYFLQKFFPTQWGMNLPLQLVRNQSLGIPKYKSNSDVLRSNLIQENRDREKNKSLSKQANLSYSLSKTPNSKILAYTVKNITLTGNLKEQITNTSTASDTTRDWSYNGAYRLEFPKDKLALKIYKNYSFYFFPKSFNNEGLIKASFPKKWDWYAQGDSSFWKPRAQTVDTKNIDTNNEISYDIFSDITAYWKLATKRDLMQRKEVKNINLGEETDRDQTFKFGYDPVYTDFLLDFNAAAQSSYKQIRRVTKYADSTLVKFDGNVNRTIRISGVLKNSDLLAGLANLISTDPNKNYSSNKRESDSSFDPGMGNMEDKGDQKPEERPGTNTLSNPLPDNSLQNLKEEEEKKRKDEMRDEDKRSLEEQEKDRLKKEENKDDIISFDEKGNKEEKKEETSEKKPLDPQSMSPRNLIASGIGLLARFQNFNLNYENQYGSQFDQKKDTPGFNYQIGLPNTYPLSDLRSRNVDDSYSASTGFPLFKYINTDIKYAGAVNKRFSSSSNQIRSTTWPDVKVTLNSFEKIIKAQNILTSSRINSAYSYTLKQNGTIDWSKINSEIQTISFSPLIGFTGNWIYDITSSVSASKTNNKSLTYGTDYTNIRQSDKMSYNASIGYTFTAENGIKLPFVKKRIILKNQMESELSFLYEDELTFTDGRQGRQKDIDKTKFSVTPRASYNFHRNVKGGLTGTFEANKNNMNGETTNIFRLEMWVEVQF